MQEEPANQRRSSQAKRNASRRETRWNREFAIESNRKRIYFSKLGQSRAISAEQLAAEWPQWSTDQRRDFCDALHALPRDSRADICKFLIQNADFRLLVNNVITLCDLPQVELTPWLLKAIQSLKLGCAINYLQALAWIRAPEASLAIRDRLCLLQKSKQLLRDDPFINWVAAEAVYCVEHLIRLGAHPGEFHKLAAQLANHACPRIRELYATYLSVHFP